MHGITLCTQRKNEAQMKHEYHEGPEAKDRFDKLATALFRVRLNLP